MMLRAKNCEKDPMETAFKGYLCGRQRLKNGWYGIFLKNHVVILFKRGYADIVCGNVKSIFEAQNGKFMITKKDKTKAVYTADGNLLADYDTCSDLFLNGWYTVSKDGDVSLFDEKDELICNKVKKVAVYRDGRYFISVLSGGDATKVGFHDADGTLITFTNDRYFKRLTHYFFIADGSLFDVTGECLIEANQGSTFNRNLVRFIGKLFS